MIFDPKDLERAIFAAANAWLAVKVPAFLRWDNAEAYDALEDGNPAFVNLRGAPLSPELLVAAADLLRAWPSTLGNVRFDDGACVATFEIQGAFPGHVRVVRLIQHECFDTNANPDLPDVRIRYLVRTDNGDAVAADVGVSLWLWLVPYASTVCGGPRGDFHAGCGKLDCTWNKRNLMNAGFLGQPDLGYHDM